MDISIEDTNCALIVHLSGRIDAYTSQELRDRLSSQVDAGHYRLVLDLDGVDYLSSAGIRVLLALKGKVDERDGDIKLACVQAYPLGVLKISGLLTFFSVHETVEEATASFPAVEDVDKEIQVETHQTSIGAFGFVKGDSKPSEIRVTGSNLDFLYARCSKESIISESLPNIKYSLGIGALGEKADDYINRLGELMIIGGTVVWVPTDGTNIPDYLIPKEDVQEVKVHTPFNIILDGVFNEVARFEASNREGASIRDIYQNLFELSRKRIDGFRGVLGLVMRADVGSVFGAGIKRSPIVENAPENAELITHQDNIKDWLNFQVEPEHENTTALVVGVGLEPDSDFETSLLQSIFYIPPKTSRSRLFSISNQGRSKRRDRAILHNHAAIFKFLPEAHSGYRVENEIANVIKNGEFVGMEHLMDNSIFKKGIMGLSYVQKIVHELQRRQT